jgi:hypothetical protein
MQLQLGMALILVAVVASTVLVIDREHRMAPFVALAMAAIQLLMVLGILDVIRHVWRIEFILPAAQFIAGYTVYTETQKKRAITASTVLLVVTMLELAFLLGRIRP